MSYWISSMWAGTPGWALAPVTSILSAIPFAALFGVERGIQTLTIVTQIVAAWGAYVFARSLWGQGIAAVLAGVFYGLGPIMTTHALFGVEPASVVLAVAPGSSSACGVRRAAVDRDGSRPRRSSPPSACCTRRSTRTDSCSSGWPSWRRSSCGGVGGA